jgi:hypothetical protein
LRIFLFGLRIFSFAHATRSAIQPKGDRDRSGFVSIAGRDLAADRERSNVIRLTRSTTLRFGGIEWREADLALSPENALVSAVQIIEYLSGIGVDIGASRTRSLGRSIRVPQNPASSENNE